MIAQSTSGGSPLTLLVFALPLLMIFFMMRSQKKRSSQQQAMQRSAQVGDEIMTTGGIFGTIVDEDEDQGTVEVEISPGTRIRMVRAGIARRVEEDVEDDGDTDENAEGPIRS